MLRNFDVYAVQVPRKKAPTKFGFALKSSDSVHMFETPEDDYIHYVCTDTGESLREWLACLRAAKVRGSDSKVFLATVVTMQNRL